MLLVGFLISDASSAKTPWAYSITETDKLKPNSEGRILEKGQFCPTSLTFWIDRLGYTKTLTAYQFKNKKQATISVMKLY